MIKIFKIKRLIPVSLSKYLNKKFEFDFSKQNYFYKNKKNATNVANFKFYRGSGLKCCGEYPNKMQCVDVEVWSPAQDFL